MDQLLHGIERLSGTGRLGAVRDLAADHLATLIRDHDRRLRGPGQLAAIQVIRAEYDNTVAALRRRCDSGDASGAVALALSLTWFWQLFGRNADAAHWLGEALAGELLGHPRLPGPYGICWAPGPGCAAPTTTPIRGSAGSPPGGGPRWARRPSPRPTGPVGNSTPSRPPSEPTRPGCRDQ